MRRARWNLLFLFSVATALYGCSRSAIPMDVDGDGIPDHRDSDIGGWSDQDTSDTDSFWIDTQSVDSTTWPLETDSETDTGAFDTARPVNTDSGQIDTYSSSSDTSEDTLPATDNSGDTETATETETDTETDSTIPYPPAAVHMWKCIICQ